MKKNEKLKNSNRIKQDMFNLMEYNRENFNMTNPNLFFPMGILSTFHMFSWKRN
jgi:hypothetical protein